VQKKYQDLNDSKTGAGLYGCKGEGESACSSQYTAAKDGSAKLDSLLDSFALNADEKEVLAHFQDINHNDERVADHAWLQSFWGESGVVGGTLSGGAAALAAAERAAATKAVAEAAGGAKGTANTALKLGETQTINDVNMTRVGRWMSPDELAQMQSGNKIVQGAAGKPLSKLTVPLILRGLRLKAPSMSSLMFQVVDCCRVVRTAGTK
jgi:hypothetical protein